MLIVGVFLLLIFFSVTYKCIFLLLNHMVYIIHIIIIFIYITEIIILYIMLYCAFYCIGHVGFSYEIFQTYD